MTWIPLPSIFSQRGFLGGKAIAWTDSQCPNGYDD